METPAWPWEERGGEGSSPTRARPRCGAWGLKEARNWYLYPFLPTALFHFSCLSLSLPCLCFQMEEQRLGILPWVSEMSMLVTNCTFDSAGDTLSSETGLVLGFNTGHRKGGEGNEWSCIRLFM